MRPLIATVIALYWLAPPAFGQIHSSLNFDHIVLRGALQDEPAVDEASDAPPTAAPDRWKFEVSPFAWLVTFDANVTVKGFETSVDMDFSDIWDDLDMAGMLHLRARKNKWAFQADFFYAKLSTEGDVGRSRDLTGDIVITGEVDKQLFFRDIVIPFGFDRPFDIPEEVDVDVSVGIDIFIAEFFVGYDLFSVRLGDEPVDPTNDTRPTLVIAPYGGLRYTRFDTEVNVWLFASVGNIGVSDKIEIDDDEDWIDPVVGLDVGLLDVGKWSYGVRGDVGGFGVSDGSDFAWSIALRASYRVNHRFVLFGGYAWLDYDFSTGSGAKEFGLDGKLEGPTLGGGFTF